MKIAKSTWEIKTLPSGKKDFNEHNVNIDVDSANVILKSYMRTPIRVSSHGLVDLLGQNDFTSVGSALLKLFGFLEKEEIDVYYTIRGAIVEHFVPQVLKQEYAKKGIDINVESYETDDFEGMNQFNGKYNDNRRMFSGVIDSKITSPREMVVEVKSKEFEKYDKNGNIDTEKQSQRYWIVEKGQYPKNEVLQGRQLAYLDNENNQKVLMVWGFVKDSLVKRIKSFCDDGFHDIYYIKGKNVKEKLDMTPIIERIEPKIDEIDFFIKSFDVNADELKKQHNELAKLVQDTYREKKISLGLFNADEIKEIYAKVAELRAKNE